MYKFNERQFAKACTWLRILPTVFSHYPQNPVQILEYIPSLWPLSPNFFSSLLPSSLSFPFPLLSLLSGVYTSVCSVLICSTPLRGRHRIKRVRDFRLPGNAILPVQLHRHLPVLVAIQERSSHHQLIGPHAGLVVERVACACRTKGACYVLACAFREPPPDGGGDGL